MKVLAAVISAAAANEVANDAWIQVAAAYGDLYDAVYDAYVGRGLPARNSLKKANRLRDFYNKVENFPGRVSDSCANFAGSGDPDAFVPPYYDSEDICHSINNFIASIKSYHDAFVCMDDVNLTTHNGWAPHKMNYLIQRQRNMLFTRKWKQLGCNLPIAPTPPPCETNPCDGLDNCQVLVNGCSVAPSRNNQVGTVPAALNYKFSADVLCDHSMALDNIFKNIFHVSAGENFGAAGDRTFALWRYPSENKLYFTVNDPNGNGADHSQFSDYVCTDGEWNTYSVEVKQVDGSPTDLRYVVSVDGTQIAGGTYNYQSSVTSGDLQVFVSDDWYDAGSAFSVRNFYYQTFADTPFCSDPCDGLENCYSVVDGCAIAPAQNNYLATVPAALGYKASAEVFCDHSAPLDSGAHTQILRLGAGPDYGAAGDRTLALFRATNSHDVHFAINNPTNTDAHQEYVDISCTDGQWTTYTIEVTDAGNGELNYVASVDGTTVMSGIYAASGSKTTGDLTAYVADNYYAPAPASKVRNFYYQTL